MNAKLHSLIDKVSSLKTLHRAYRLLALRASASGIDGVSWKHYRQDLQSHLEILGLSLLRETYTPAPYKIMTRADATGKVRQFSVPTIEDRVVQRAIRLCIEPFYETRVFTDCSFEYRPGRHPSMAAAIVENFYQRKRLWVLEVDVESFFSSVHRDKLDRYLAQYLADGKVLRLIQQCLGMSSDGLPIGNGLSPFLSNVYLHEVDAQLKANEVYHLRFCDTFLLFVQTQEALPQMYMLLQGMLEDLHLKLNENKTRCWYAPDAQMLVKRV